MKLEYLPVEGDDTWIMYSFVNENNEVIWSACSSIKYDQIIGTNHAEFMVCRRGKIVIVEDCGWFGPTFHFRFELTNHTPDQVVILANETSALMERAMEWEPR